MSVHAVERENLAEELKRTSVLPDGRRLVQVGDKSFKLLTPVGELVAYLRAEHVEYKPTMAEQRALQEKR